MKSVLRMTALGLCVGILVVLAPGCKTTVSQKTQDPLLDIYARMGAEIDAIALRPVEYGVEDLGIVQGKSYQVIKKNRFFKKLRTGRPYTVLEGDNPLSDMTVMITGAPKLSELETLAAARAIASTSGAEALYITQKDVTQDITGRKTRREVVITGRALALKDMGTMPAERFDERTNARGRAHGLSAGYGPGMTIEASAEAARKAAAKQTLGTLFKVGTQVGAGALR